MFHAKNHHLNNRTTSTFFLKKKSLISIICFSIPYFLFKFFNKYKSWISTYAISIKNPFQLKNIKFSLNIYNKILLKQFFFLKTKVLLKITKLSLKSFLNFSKNQNFVNAHFSNHVSSNSFLFKKHSLHHKK